MKLKWIPTRVKLGQMKAWEGNPRMSTKAQAKRIIDSEKTFGQPVPFILNPLKDGMYPLLDGHQRLAAWFTVYGADYEMDAMVANRELTEAEHKQLIITLHTGATGEWNWQMLSGWNAGELQEWGMNADTLKQWNNDANNLKEMLKSETTEPVDAEPQIDRAAELQAKWQTEMGQLWKLGEHRLLIGDCTVRENVERLMGGERVEFTFTDPPYNVGKDYGNETNDNREKEDYKQWSCLWFTVCKEFTEAIAFTPGAVNVWMWAEIEKPKWMAIWVKTNQVSRNQAGGFNTYEPFLCFGKIKVDYDTWNIPIRQEDIAHPVPKTVEAWQKILSDLIHDYKNIYEPFAGSGTTIIAAQNLSRRCYAMEISCAYSAVILERFSQAFPDEEIRLMD